MVGDMFGSTRKILQEFYKPYNKDLANLLNDPKFEYKKKIHYDNEYSLNALSLSLHTTYIMNCEMHTMVSWFFISALE